MSFFLRKSLRFGPVRFNLSKSGIGVSAGVKGLRIGTGPRGNYVYAGRGGIYYRKTLGRPRVRSILRTSAPTQSPPAIDTIRPTDAKLFADETAAGLLAELNQKRRRWRIWPAIAVMFALTTLLLFAALSVGQPFERVWVIALAAFVLGLLVPIAARQDRGRTTTVLFYHPEGATLNAFESLHSALEEIAKSSKLWMIARTTDYSDHCFHTSAVTQIDRRVVRIVNAPPPLIKTNIPVFALLDGSQGLYFFPDRLHS